MPNVKVILNEKVDKLGEVGEVVSVKPGYARNFLLPEGLATIPTSGEVKRILKKKALLEKQYQEEKLQAENLIQKLASIGEITFSAQAGEAGKLFGRITAKDIAEKLSELLGEKVERKQVLLRHSISELGEFDIKLKLHNEITGEIKVVIKNQE